MRKHHTARVNNASHDHRSDGYTTGNRGRQVVLWLICVRAVIGFLIGMEAKERVLVESVSGSTKCFSNLDQKWGFLRSRRVGGANQSDECRTRKGLIIDLCDFRGAAGGREKRAPILTRNRLRERTGDAVTRDARDNSHPRQDRDELQYQFNP
jgi:hypothetical protein